MPARTLYRALLKALLSAADRRLWKDNLRASGRPDLDDLALAFAGTGVLTRARSSIPGSATSFWSTAPDPAAAGSVALPLATGEAAVSALERLLSGLGEERVHRGVPYRAMAAGPIALQPSLAWSFHAGTLIMSTNEARLRQILDTRADPDGHPSLLSDPRTKARWLTVGPETRWFLWADLQALVRTPTQAEPRGGHLWDLRGMWVLEHHDPREAMMRKRQELLTAFQASHGRAPGNEERETLETELERFGDEHEASYGVFEAGYRKRLGVLDALGQLFVRAVGDEARVEVWSEQ